MLSGRVGLGPLARNPHARLRKGDGTLVHLHDDLDHWYNVEGEASMRRHTSVVVNINRAMLAKKRSERESEDALALDRWLSSYASLNDGVAPERVIRVWNERKQKFVNKKVNVLLVCRLFPGEKWGSCTKTINRYRDSRVNALAEKQSTETGKLQVIHGRKHPEVWTAAMSRQEPLEGYEHRGRTPSIVEMLSVCKVNTKHVVRDSTKVVNVIPAVTNVPVASAANSAPVKFRPLAVLAGKESSILALKESRIKVWQDPCQRVVDTDWRQEGGDDLDEDLRANCSEYITLQNTLSVPDLMAALRYPDSKNFITPTSEQLWWFNEDHPILNETTEAEDGAWQMEVYWLRTAPDESRLHAWLLKHAVHYVAPRQAMPSRKGYGDAVSQRLRFLDNQYLLGRIPRSQYYKARGLILAADRRGRGLFVLVGSPYGDPKRQGFPAYVPPTTVNHKLKGLPKPVPLETCELVWSERIGLDTMPPMSEAEYENITRSAPDSVDRFLLSAGIIGIKDFDTGLTARAQAFRDEQLEQFHTRVLGAPSIGDTFHRDPGNLILTPNYESEGVFEIIERTSVNNLNRWPTSILLQ